MTKSNSVRTNRVALTDAGFWIAVADERDGHHAEAVRIAESLRRFHVVLPWPIAYEAASTRMMRRSAAALRLQRVLAALRAEHVDDAPYRERSLRDVFTSAKADRAISLADMVTRALIREGARRIDFLITYNPNDFRDVCAARRVEIVSRSTALG